MLFDEDFSLGVDFLTAEDFFFSEFDMEWTEERNDSFNRMYA